MYGVRLLLFHPELPSCADCKKWMTNEDWSFTTRKGNDGKDHRVPNWDGKTPCNRCPKIPKDDPKKVPESAMELNDKNWAAYSHYKECKAVGDWPKGEEGVDSIVRRNAAMIRDVEDDYARYTATIPLREFLTHLHLVAPPRV